MKNFLKYFLRIVLGILGGGSLVWMGGFLWFLNRIYKPPQDLQTPTDAIVVLTGGSGRFETGVRLLNNDLAQCLFVTGVHPHTSLSHLNVLKNLDRKQKKCIDLGHKAFNTWGNAQETKLWMNQRGYGSLRLVTAYYHIPRSLLEFQQHMPNLIIIPHPAFGTPPRPKNWNQWAGPINRIVREYNKFFYVFMKYHLYPFLYPFTVTVPKKERSLS